jgi:hypothetical protein
MSLELLKILFAAALIAAGTTAFASQMALMGKAERKGDPERIRKRHRAAGRVFVALLVPLAFLGAKFLIDQGDSPSILEGLHIVLALALFVIVLLKVLIVRIYKGFLRLAPTLGMTIFALMLVVVALGAAFAGLNLISK